jgi:MFS family permease
MIDHIILPNATLMMQMYRKLKELPRENWALFLSILINRLGNMSIVFLVLYLHKELNYSVTTAASIFAVYGLSALVAGPLGGWLCDRFGALKIMVITMVLNACALFIYPFAHGIISICIVTIFWSLACESFRPANLTAVSYFCSKEQRKAAYALNRLGINLGMSIGPILGGIIATHYFSSIFFINGMACLGAACIISYQFHQLIRETKLDRNQLSSYVFSLFRVLKNKELSYLLLLFLMVAMLFFQHSSTLSLFVVRDLHFSPQMFGLTFTINTLLIIFFEVPLNLVTSEWPITTTMTLGSLCTAIGFGLFAFTQNFAELAGAVAIWTFGEMLLFPSIAAYISDLAPSHLRGAYMGLFSMTMNGALMLGPLFGSFIMANFGSKELWLLCFLWGLSAAILFGYLPIKGDIELKPQLEE